MRRVRRVREERDAGILVLCSFYSAPLRLCASAT